MRKRRIRALIIGRPARSGVRAVVEPTLPAPASRRVGRRSASIASSCACRRSASSRRRSSSRAIESSIDSRRWATERTRRVSRSSCADEGRPASSSASSCACAARPRASSVALTTELEPRTVEEVLGDPPDHLSPRVPNRSRRLSWRGSSATCSSVLARRPVACRPRRAPLEERRGASRASRTAKTRAARAVSGSTGAACSHAPALDRTCATPRVGGVESIERRGGGTNDAEVV